MRPNPIVAGLGLLLAALLVAGGVTIRDRRSRPVARAVAAQTVEAAAPRARHERARPPARERVATARACVPRAGMACVVGRVEFPRDIPEHPRFEELALAVRIRHDDAPAARADEREDERADDAARVAIDRDGHFQAQLPAGRYDLDVDAFGSGTGVGGGDARFTGGLDDLRAGAGDVIDDLVIAMERGVAIDGTVRGMRGIPVAGAVVRARRAGARGGVNARAVEVTTDNRGRFHLGGLRRGDFDLVVAATGSHRGRHLARVAAPVTALLIDVARRPILLGALPSAGDGACPSAHLEVDGEDGGMAMMELSDGCTFATELPPDAGEVHIAGTVGGRPVSTSVIVPPDGDPAPVCLLGPCAAVPAAAVVAVIGAAGDSGGARTTTNGRPGRGATTSLTYAVRAGSGDSDGDGSTGGSTTVRGEPSALTLFEGLPAGRHAQFSAARQGESGDVIAYLSAGVTEVLVQLGTH